MFKPGRQKVRKAISSKQTQIIRIKSNLQQRDQRVRRDLANETKDQETMIWMRVEDTFVMQDDRIHEALNPFSFLPDGGIN